MSPAASDPPTQPTGPDGAAAARLSLADLFPAADYHHRLRLSRGTPAEFFAPWTPAPSPDTTPLLAERRHWLLTEPARHALLLPEAAPLIRETARLAEGWGAPPLAADTPPSAAWITLGSSLEPDLVLLARQPGSPRFVMVAGAVCFPSGWAPESKLGLALDAIHAVVPDLNSELGAALDRFLDRLRPGTAWWRSNWGLSASAERNQHPARGLPRLRLPLAPESVLVRLEHQALLALPATGGLLFGIRIESIPLGAFRCDPALADGLARALRSMPGEMARYKGLAEVRAAVVDFLVAPRSAAS